MPCMVIVKGITVQKMGRKKVLLSDDGLSGFGVNRTPDLSTASLVTTWVLVAHLPVSKASGA